MQESNENIVILGNGPAAYMAGIYAATANMNPLIIQDQQSALFNIEGVDKVAGLLNCETKDEYLDLMKEQAKRFDVRIIETTILKCNFNNFIEIETKEGKYKCKALIIDNNDILNTLIKEEKYFENGYIKCDKKTTRTPIDGLFVCGDAREKIKEAILLSSSGCMAALDAKEFIECEK